MGRHDLPLHIYDEMVDKARRAGTAIPDGPDPDTAWVADARGRVSYGGVEDWAAPAPMSFRHDNGSEYVRVDPDELGGP